MDPAAASQNSEQTPMQIGRDDDQSEVIEQVYCNKLYRLFDTIETLNEDHNTLCTYITF